MDWRWIVLVVIYVALVGTLWKMLRLRYPGGSAEWLERNQTLFWFIEGTLLLTLVLGSAYFLAR